MAPIATECDYLVIGGGSGGLASARRASQYGAKTIAVESSRLGGTCVNVGCVPKKVTWNAAFIAETLRDAKAYGFSFEESAPFDWSSFTHKRDEYIKRLNGIYERNLVKDNVEYVHGHARFLDANSVSVRLDDGSQQVIKAKSILIAVGGEPNIPSSIPGAELGTTSDGFFELKKQPKKVALVGGGYIAIELAGMFNALGTETHLFFRHDKFLRTFDPMLQNKIMEEYRRQGMHLHASSKQERIEDIGHGLKRVHYKDSNGSGTVDVESLIWAIGRSPKFGDLDLDKTGVKLASSGHITVDDYQVTNVPHIFSLGDCCDKGFELTPVAIAAGRRLSDRVFGGQKGARLEYSNIPSVIFAHPEAGSIGLTEPVAREQFGDTNVKVYSADFTGMYFAMMEQDQKGPTAYKIICEGENERVVGLHILGQASSEILQGFGVAIKMGATKKDFDSCVAIHPTSAEELVTMK